MRCRTGILPRDRTPNVGQETARVGGYPYLTKRYRREGSCPISHLFNRDGASIEIGLRRAILNRAGRNPCRG